jgi:2-octaprenylphenol hydroxylase
MKKYDVLIIGGGMVGLTLALAIRKLSHFTVAVADTLPISELTEQPDLRVSAINAASQTLFEHLDVWQNITEQRSQAYHHMHIWDKAGYGKLNFDGENVANEQLGFIIENNVIRNALWHQAQRDEGISFYNQAKINSVGIGESEVFVSFESGNANTANMSNNAMPMTAKIVVGADGANSWLRNQLQVPMVFRDYDHHAIVATVACEQGHQNTAWQVFLETGPLAFLPLQDSQGSSKLASIVWSTSPEEAQRLINLNADDFSKEITAAADGKLGKITLRSELATYPLRMRLAQNFTQERAMLIGDAAHTIHPLAGQGVNLGLKDAAALAQTLAQTSVQKSQLTNDDDDKSTMFDYDPIQIKQFERWRKNDATEMIAMMEAIKQSFTPQQKPVQILRGLGMTLLNNLPPIKKQLMKQALGYQSHMPKLMK